ncbi:MAG: SiaB family protein kinase [Vicingaceae bacterium]
MTVLKKEKLDFMDLVFNYHLSMKKYRIILIYDGEIDQTITKAFISLVEKNLTDWETERKIIRKVYHIMVEFLQNIHKHADSTDENQDSRKGIFLVGHDASGYIIISGNAVKKGKMNKMKSMLDKVNGMDEFELKEFYQRKILKDGLSDKGGAGLGFIDIIRRTGSELEYRFENIDENYSFFILKTYIAT